MKQINKLPPHISNKISAGEVITEPLNVVKELIENSLDAGAGRIHVEIRQGGLESIEISDDGRGIDYDDASLLFERHATSKISESTDLYRIASLGFRGEALASIAAISKVHVHSRHADALQGFSMIQYGSQLLSLRRSARERGTLIEVRNLFFNTPVRERFLRGIKSLEKGITDFMSAMALGHPEIQFRYTVDDKVLFTTRGDGDQEAVLYEILGQQGVEDMIPLRHEEEDLLIEGYLSNLKFSRSNRQAQYFFVNGRLVENDELREVLRKSYEGLLPLRRYPVALLWLKVPFEAVDVNIHPRKLEIRFSKDFALIQKLPEEFRRLLRESPLIPRYEAPREIKPFAREEEVPLEQISLDSLRREPQQKIEQMVQTREKEREAFDFAALIESMNYIGQLFASYLLYEVQDSFYLMDQHAAHEKVLYEAFKADYAQKQMHSQMLMVAMDLSLDASSFSRYEKLKDLEELGFETEVFGARHILVRAIPHRFTEAQAKAFLLDYLQTDRLLEDESERIQRACKAAIKASRKVHEMEEKALRQSLMNLEDPFTCPHGRPIFIRYTKAELERRFERS